VSTFFRNFDGVLVTLAILNVLATESAHAAASNTGNDVWMRTFSMKVGNAYVINPPQNFEQMPAAGDIYIELVSLEKNRSELISFQTKKTLGQGCFININPAREIPQHSRCQEQAHRKIKLKNLRLPECPVGINRSSAANAGYFVSDQATRAVCVYDLFTAHSERSIKELHTYSSNLFVEPIAPLWTQEQFANIQRNNIGLLASIFPSAPIAQLNKIGLNGSRNCLGLPYGLAAFPSGKKSNSNNAEIPTLSNSVVRWTYVYLVRTEKQVYCADARYEVDVVNQPLVQQLTDGTMLIKGQNNVLRIRIKDGSVDADSRLAKRVASREFIEILQRDGGASCESQNSSARCKWLEQQGWYKYKIQHANENVDELMYSKFWFQGFDHAIKRMFFNKRDF
jgi:hypothetical protein